MSRKGKNCKGKEFSNTSKGNVKKCEANRKNREKMIKRMSKLCERCQNMSNVYEIVINIKGMSKLC